MGITSPNPLMTLKIISCNVQRGREGRPRRLCLSAPSAFEDRRIALRVGSRAEERDALILVRSRISMLNDVVRRHFGVVSRPKMDSLPRKVLCAPLPFFPASHDRLDDPLHVSGRKRGPYRPDSRPIVSSLSLSMPPGEESVSLQRKFSGRCVMPRARAAWAFSRLGCYGEKDGSRVDEGAHPIFSWTLLRELPRNCRLRETDCNFLHDNARYRRARERNASFSPI